MRIHVRKLVGTILIVLLLSSCARDQENAEPTATNQVPDPIQINDGGFLTSEPCGPPCFWGIIPGQTKEEEVIRLFREKGWIDRCERYVSSVEGGDRVMQCMPNILVTFSEDTGIVDIIGFMPSTPISVGDVLETYGIPTCVLVVPDGVPEHPYTGLVLYYENIITELTLYRQEGVGYRIDPETVIFNIAYDTAIADECDSIDGDPWKGFGEYDSPG